MVASKHSLLESFQCCFVGTYVGVNEFVNGRENVLVAGHIVKGIGTVFLDPACSVSYMICIKPE